jgi:hypothetical protein
VATHSKRVLEYVSDEIPNGIIDGLNTIFTLNNIPVFDSVKISLNGLVQFRGISRDYTISGNTITFSKAPKTNSKLFVCYFK